MPEVLPDLGLAAAAGFLLLIAAALWVLAELIRQSFGRIPVIGPWVGANIVAALNDARHAVLRASSSAWHAAVALLNWLSDYLWRMFLNVALWMGAATTTVEHIALVQIPLEVSRVEGEVVSAADAAQAYALGLARAAEHLAAAEVAQLRSDVAAALAAVERAVTADVNAVRSYIDTEVATVERDIANTVAAASTVLAADITAAEQLAAADVAALRAVVVSDVAALERDLAAGVATAEQLAFAQLQALQRGIYTDLETWGNEAVSVAWPDPVPDLRALRDALQGDFPWLNDLIGALGGVGAAGLVGALIRSLAGAHAITRLATDCIVPNCRNLSGLGGDLSQLLSLGMDAALIGWVAYCIADPEGAAANTFDVASPITAPVLGGLESLLGVKP